MIKAFRYKEITLRVKTNMLKKGECYFGERSIPSELERAYKEGQYSKTNTTTGTTFLIDIYKRLTAVGIKPYELSGWDLVYTGASMTDLNKQTTLEE